ncbi:hypothetical protein JOF56_011227 [Kibdelosporangium banguiense]|uniref:Cell wall anchor protein n=1 Tax=Kibdelosporangium banguiense TaxID=1365924 RepID=A0ABS4U2F0_9PSEU|nr:DUF6319 family protein [Kibdelosporangium banguiense]MBP2330842.1 hypothetical protein [Kibdelosporangium banguiense]
MLSEQDITQLRDALAAGKPATVWFTAKAVGVDPGKSGKVLSFAEPAEGDFIEVKPTGSQDALSFSKAELTLTKPKRPPAPKKPAPAPPAAAVPVAAAPEPAETEIYQPAPVEKPAKRPARRQSNKPPAEVTVTLHSTSRGDWTVEVVVGSKRSVRAVAVPAAAIAKIARELPSQVEDAISAVMAAARQQHQERIALLQAELDAARRALNELS